MRSGRENGNWLLVVGISSVKHKVLTLNKVTNPERLNIIFQGFG